MRVYITDHAIHRFQERFHRYPAWQVIKLLEAAYTESVLASVKIKRKIRQMCDLRESTEYRYHSSSSLVLVLEPIGDGNTMSVITVYPVV